MCCSSCKFEKLLPLALVIVGGDDATVVDVVLFVVAVVIWQNPFVGTAVAIFCISSRDWMRASVSGCEPKKHS